LQGSAGHEGLCCMDGPLAFSTSDLEVGFALRYASQGRKGAVAASVVTTLLSALSLGRCVSLAASDGLTPRLALLIALSAVLLSSHAWTLAAVLQPSQVSRTALKANPLSRLNLSSQHIRPQGPISLPK
jgi:hypothetical protein